MKASKLTKETVLDVGLKDRGFPEFQVGDLIEVFQIVKEGTKEREQKFEGNVIAFRNNGAGSSFIVRRISAKGIGVERIFPLHSPAIARINKLKSGTVRRAKLFYLRERIGKEAKIKGH